MTTKSKTLSQAEIKTKVDSGHRAVKDWKEFHGLLESMRDTAWIFRGVSSPSHYLIPSIGREKIFGPYKLVQEQRLFSEFKNRAITSIECQPFTSDWHWLAYAQHIGIPTRLLDWSSNPLVAAYFALESDSDSDRVIYAAKYSQYIHEVDHGIIGPFENKQEGRFSAPFAFDRIRAQRGLFTIHPEPTKIFYKPGMKSILISNELVKDFRKRLFKYGIDHWHIYPDAHGLGRQLSWQFKNKVGLGTVFTSASKYS